MKIKFLVAALFISGCTPSEAVGPRVYNVTYEEIPLAGCHYGAPRSANTVELGDARGAWYDYGVESRAEFPLEEDSQGFHTSEAVNPDFPDWPFGECNATYDENGNWFCDMDRGPCKYRVRGTR